MALDDIIDNVTESGGRVLDVWRHARLDCIATQNPMGHYCGYVGTNMEDPVDVESGMAFTEDMEVPVSVHGGVTYGPDKDGWYGFDTGHAWDIHLDKNGYVILTPTAMSLLPVNALGVSPEDYGEPTGYRKSDIRGFGNDDLRENIYWTPEKVKEETESLAEQLAAVQGVPRYRVVITEDDVTVHQLW